MLKSLANVSSKSHLLCCVCSTVHMAADFSLGCIFRRLLTFVRINATLKSRGGYKFPLMCVGLLQSKLLTIGGGRFYLLMWAHLSRPWWLQLFRTRPVIRAPLGSYRKLCTICSFFYVRFDSQGGWLRRSKAGETKRPRFTRKPLSRMCSSLAFTWRLAPAVSFRSWRNATAGSA